MKKKALKIVLGIFLLVLLILIAIPFFLEAKAGDLIKNRVNNNIHGTLDFEQAKLSLIRSFPNAEIRLQGIYLLNEDPFKGDTLFSAESVALKLGLGELFKSADDPISLKQLNIDQASLNIKVDEEENANYDIGKTSTNIDAAESRPADQNFNFAMESYEISDSEIRYTDLASGLQLLLTGLNHQGSGDLSLDKSELQTTTTSLVSLAIDSTTYLKDHKVDLEALIGIDLKENKYSFLQNEAHINKLPLTFEGFVQLFEEHQEVALKFKTPTSDFKNFLAVIPESYTQSIENVQTAGNFQLEGEIMGRVDETHIPKLNILLRSQDASFKYPELPKAVSNINLDAKVKNTTGIAEDTYVEINNVSFSIDQDRFEMRSIIKELMGNTKVAAKLKAKMNLANISKAYPVPDDFDLGGMLNADIATSFDMDAVEKEQYEKTKTEGTLKLSDFVYKTEELKQPVKLKTASLEFNSNKVNLKEMTGSTGSTDFKAEGEINNFLGFLFKDGTIQGDFNLVSNTFAIDDFMSSDEPGGKEGGEVASQAKEEALKIPSFLDCSLRAQANTVIYDNLRLKDVKGNLKIKDQTATLSNMTSSLFDGQMAFSGRVSTKTSTPEFNMNLGMQNFRIGETFKAMEVFRIVAPIASALEGKLNSEIKLSGNLQDDFSPDLKTISGNVLAELLATDINPQKAKMLTSLTDKLNFINLKDLNLQGLKTALSFEDGMVKVKPFTINYQDISIQVEGGHTFDQQLTYKATLDVPAKYLGSEVNNLIAKIDESELVNLTIPVVANIGGAYTSPEVNTDLTSGVSKLTSKLVELQKQKLLNQGKDKAKGLLSGILSDKDSDQNETAETRDTTQTNLGDAIGGLLKNNTEKEQDTVDKSTNTQEDALKNTAKGVLGGLFNRKKKEEAKDSIN